MISSDFAGIIFALASSICFAGNRSVASKPLLTSGPLVATYISLLVGVFVTASATVASGQVSDLIFVALSTLVIFGVVGVIHFGIARQISFIAIKNIGANESSPIMATQVLYSLFFAVLFLGEELNIPTALGAFVILLGVFFLERRTGATKRKGNVKVGIIAAALTGLIYGLTPILIRYGLLTYHFFIAATFIAYAISMAIYGLSLSPKMIAGEIRALPRFTLLSFIVSGVLATSAQLFRFDALGLAPVVLVTPLLASHPIFTVLFTRKLAKDFEVFQPRVIISIVLVVLGTVLVSYYSGAAG